MLKKLLKYLGRITISRVGDTGRLFFFIVQGFFHIFTSSLQVNKIVSQVYIIGVKSLLIIILTGIFTGMVLGLQGYYTLVKFGSEGLLGSAVALTLIRELGPVLTGIMVAARAGSAMAAEIGIMRISEQIDALDTMDINPVRFLFSPRLAASIISFPILTAVFNLVGILGSYLTGSMLLGINSGIFFSRVRDGVVMADITGSFIKALVFSMVVAITCCYHGFFTHIYLGFGAKGVSDATTSAVVQSCVMILITDYLITYILL